MAAEARHALRAAYVPAARIRLGTRTPPPTDPDDGLRASRGILTGLLLGAAFWIASIAIVLFIVR
ncbi:MAG TPA: hypothetical protein VIV63_11950 [Steroidobacteraceae bacterium]